MVIQMNRLKQTKHSAWKATGTAVAFATVLSAVMLFFSACTGDGENTLDTGKTGAVTKAPGVAATTPTDGPTGTTAGGATNGTTAGTTAGTTGGATNGTTQEPAGNPRSFMG